MKQSDDKTERTTFAKDEDILNEDDLLETDDILEIDDLPDTDVLLEIDDAPETGGSLKTDVLPDTDGSPETDVLPDTDDAYEKEDVFHADSHLDDTYDVADNELELEDEDDNDMISSSINYVEDEADAAFDKSERKNKTGSILRKIVLFIALAVFCYSAYMLINIFLEYKRDSDIYKNIDTDVVDNNATISVELPEGNVVIPFQYDHASLMAINSEGLGYIYVPGINKRLPFAQTTNNEYYIRHAFDHSFSMAGSIFVDCRVTEKLDAAHVVIHGHNRKDGTMFAWLKSYLDHSFYKRDGYDKFYLYTENRVMQYRIFSVYITDPISDTYNFNLSDPEALKSYAARMKERSVYDTGVDVSNVTQIVTLSTCTDDTTRRIIVHGIFEGQAPINTESNN